MSKYLANSAGDVGEIGSPGCGDLAPYGGWINDKHANGCWKVDGPMIPLGPEWVSLHAACEIINAAFYAVSDQPAISNSVYLPGSVHLTRS
jgi:hypothetical protein